MYSQEALVHHSANLRKFHVTIEQMYSANFNSLCNIIVSSIPFHVTRSYQRLPAPWRYVCCQLEPIS